MYSPSAVFPRARKVEQILKKLSLLDQNLLLTTAQQEFLILKDMEKGGLTLSEVQKADLVSFEKKVGDFKFTVENAYDGVITQRSTGKLSRRKKNIPLSMSLRRASSAGEL